jgi:uncharacterized membrane protein
LHDTAVVNGAVGGALVVVGVAFAAFSLLQVVTGRYRGLRRLHGAPTVQQVRAGGWVGVAISVPPILIGASWMAGGDAAAYLIVGGYLVIALGGVWALQQRLKRRQAARRGH